MDRLTYGSEAIEARVQADFRWATSILASKLKGASFILLGSFGRGEGRVIPGKNRPHYLSDVEVAAVRWRPFPAIALKQLSGIISDRLGCEFNVYFSPPTRFLGAHTKIARYRVDIPLLSTFDFRNGSRILQGNDYVSKMPKCEGKNIPQSEGIRLLPNRCAEYLLAPMEKLPHAADKIALASGDALLIARKAYQLRLAERATLISKHVRSPKIAAAYMAAVARRGHSDLTEVIHFTELQFLVRDAIAESGLDVRAPSQWPFVQERHSGFLPRRMWDIYLKRLIRKNQIHIQENGIPVEWAIYSACLQGFLGAPHRESAKKLIASSLHAWKLILS